MNDYTMVDLKLIFLLLNCDYFIRSKSYMKNSVLEQAGSEMSIKSKKNNMCGISTFAFVPVLV